VRFPSIHGLPAVREVEHRGFDPLKELQPAWTVHGGKTALRRESEEVDVVVLRGDRAVGQRLDELLALILGDERVRERGLPCPYERPDPQSAVREGDQRQRSDELASTERDLDGEPALLAVMAPPLDDPGVQQER